jgi:hypothetical protein
MKSRMVPSVEEIFATADRHGVAFGLSRRRSRYFSVKSNLSPFF